MGFVEGLKNVNEVLDKKAAASEDRVKATWLSLKDGDTVRIRFLQELDVDSPNYSEKNGLGKFFYEHSNPNNWRKKAECTADEGSCYGCEHGWVQKTQLYINVLVDNGKDDPYVAVLSRGTGKGSISKTLLEYASDEDFDYSISDKWFKFKREGSTKDNTTYFLMPGKKAEGSVEDHELFDLTKVVFHVTPERQEAYYLDLKDGEQREPAAAGNRGPVSPSSIDSDWV